MKMSVRDTRRSKEYFDKIITNDKRRISKFEAAAIGKRLGISDISFRGNVYYPKDLV